MRSERHHYNQLLLKYQAYQQKLNRLVLANKNQHRQSVITKHLKKLKRQLHNLWLRLQKQKATRLAVGTFLVGMLSAQAQIPTFKQKLTPAQEIGLFNRQNRTFSTFGDLDGDGDLDLLVAEHKNGFYYYENTGNYTNGVGSPNFELQTLPAGLADSIEFNEYVLVSLSLSDLDGDGDLDLLAFNAYSGNFYYYENLDLNDNQLDGAAFAAPTENTLGFYSLGYQGGYNGLGFNLADLDNDGDADLLLGDSYYGFYYFENTDIDGDDELLEAAHFTAITQRPIFNLPDELYYYHSFSLSDLDGDGDLDLLLNEIYGNFYYLENKDIDATTIYPENSDNTSIDFPYFDSPMENPFALFRIKSYGVYGVPTLGDLDGDGDLDLLLGSRGDFYYFENLDIDMGPAFGGASDIVDSPLFKSASVLGLSNVPRGKSAFGDLDGDGDLDLLTGSWDDGFYYFENSDMNNGSIDDAYFYPTQLPEGLSDINLRFSAPALADLDNDGDLDLLSGSESGDYYYFENSDMDDNHIDVASFGPQQTNPFGLLPSKPLNCNRYNQNTPSFGDLDGDGDLDIIAGGKCGGFIHFQNSDMDDNHIDLAAFNVATLSDSFSNIDIGSNSAPALCDLDSDGDLDLLSGETSPPFNYFKNSGDYEFQQTNASIGLPVTSNDTTPAFVDLDGDGDWDLLANDRNGDFFYFENVDLDLDNDGILDTAEVTFWENGASVSYAIHGDEDGDGIPNYKDTLDDGNNGDGSTTNYNDSNNDGIADIFDTDLDGKPNYVDLDSDNDGIPDVIEAQSTVDFLTPDFDENENMIIGVDDGVNTAYTGGLDPVDTDADGTPDFLDNDSDNDSQPDMFEIGFMLNASYEDNGLDTAFDYTSYNDPRAGKDDSFYVKHNGEYAFRNADFTLTTQELFMATVSLAENPVQTNFEITNLEASATVKVYALSGSLLKQKDNYQHGPIDITELARGIYFVEIQIKEQTKVLQMIKE